MSGAKTSTKVLLITLLSLFGIFYFAGDITVNPASRLATMESLVDYDTWYIDQSVFKSIDSIQIEGKTLSTKPPMLSFMGAGVYWLYEQITGHTFATHKAEAVYVVSLFFGLLAHGIFLFFFWKILQFWMRDKTHLALAYACGALAYLGYAYSPSINNHSPAAACLVAAFYFAFQIRHLNSERVCDWVYAGLFAGFSVTFDLASTFFCVPLFFYLCSKDIKKTFLYFVLPSLAPMIGHFALTYFSTGSLLPIYARRDLYAHPGSYWLNPQGLDALDEPKLKYLFNSTFGWRGVFLISPILFYGLLVLKRNLKKGTEFYREYLLTAVFMLALTIFVTFKTNNYGGICVGSRWYIVGMPFMTLWVVHWIESHFGQRGWSRTLFIALFVVTMITVIDGLDAPWSEAEISRVFSRYLYQ